MRWQLKNVIQCYANSQVFTVQHYSVWLLEKFHALKFLVYMNDINSLRDMFRKGDNGTVFGMTASFLWLKCSLPGTAEIRLICGATGRGSCPLMSMADQPGRAYPTTIVVVAVQYDKNFISRKSWILDLGWTVSQRVNSGWWLQMGLRIKYSPTK